MHASEKSRYPFLHSFPGFATHNERKNTPLLFEWIQPAFTDQIKNLLCQGFLPDMKYAVRPAMVATRHTPGAVVDVFLSGITETGPRIAQGRVNGIVKGYFESGAPQFFQQSADVLSGNMWRKDHERMAVRHLGFQSRVRRSKYLVGGFPGAEK